MDATQLLLYWEEFHKQGKEEGWDPDACDEYQFGTWLIGKSEYT